MIRDLKRMKKWHRSLHAALDNMIQDCTCHEISARRATDVANQRTLSIRTPLSYLTIYVVYIEGTPCLHIIDRATTFTVVASLPSRAMSVQIQTFNLRWRAVLGTPLTVQADQEYNSEELFNLCQEMGTKLTIVPTEAHDTQGKLKRENGVMKAFFKRIRKERPNQGFENTLVLSTFGKNACFGNKTVSAFELQFNHVPPNLIEGVEHKTIPSSII